jgi:hypothetical protein
MMKAFDAIDAAAHALASRVQDSAGRTVTERDFVTAIETARAQFLARRSSATLAAS